MTTKTQHSIHPKSLKLASSALLLALSQLSPSAFAANQFFSNAAGPLSWDTVTANWGALTTGPYSSTWTSGNTAVFEGTSGTVNVSGGSSPTVGGMKFNVTGYTLSGGTINLTGATVNIDEGVASTVTTIDSVLAGSSNLRITRNGANARGMIVLGGANAFTGSFQTDSSVISINTIANAGVASSLGAGNLTKSVLIGTGGSFGQITYTGTGGSTDRAWQLGGTGGGVISNMGLGAIALNHTGTVVTGTTAGNRGLTLRGDNTGDNSFAGLLSNMSGFTTSFSKQDAGTWILANENNSYTGVTNINAGTLKVSSLANGGSNSSIGASTNAASNVLIGNTATLQYTGSGATTDRLFTINGTAAGNGVTLDASGTGAITFSNVGSLGYGTNNQTRTLSLTGTNTGANTLAATLANNGSGALSVTKSGDGAWILSGTNTYTGATTVNAGKLQAGSTAAFGTNSALTLADVAGASLDLNNFNNTIGALAGGGVNGGNVTLGSATLSVGGLNTSTSFGGNISGTGGLTKTGTGTLTLAGTNNAYSGGTVINGGAIAISAANQLGTATSNFLTFTGSGTVDTTAAMVLPSTGTITVNAGQTATLRNRSATATTLEFAGKITGDGSVVRGQTLINGSIVRFSNDANDYTGDFKQANQTTEFTSVANAGVASALGAGTTAFATSFGTISSGSTLRYTGTGNSSTNRAIDWQGTTAFLIVQNTGTGTVQYLATSALKSGSGNAGFTLGGSNTGANVFAQVINDNGGTTTLTKSDLGTWSVTGANTYSGGTTISAGTLATGATGSFGSGNVTISAATGSLTLGNATSIADTATLSLFSGSSLFLDFNGNEQVGGLTVAGTALALNDVASSANFNTNLFSAADLIAKGFVNASGTGLLQVGASAVPEPSTYAALAGLGILGYAVLRRRKTS